MSLHLSKPSLQNTTLCQKLCSEWEKKLWRLGVKEKRKDIFHQNNFTKKKSLTGKFFAKIASNQQRIFWRTHENQAHLQTKKETKEDKGTKLTKKEKKKEQTHPTKKKKKKKKEAKCKYNNFFFNLLYCHSLLKKIFSKWTENILPIFQHYLP